MSKGSKKSRVPVRLVASGFQIKTKDFDPTKPYTYCRLCGNVIQHPNVEVRRKWSKQHAQTHSSSEHYQLYQSGLWLTAEAQNKLAAYGVVDVVAAVISEEHVEALKESKPIQPEVKR